MIGIKATLRRILNTYLFRVSFGAVVLFLSRITPKKKNGVVLIPRLDKLLNGNIKYLYLYLCESSTIDVKILLAQGDLSRELISKGYPVFCYPGVKAFFGLLRANVVITESTNWAKKYKGAATKYSKKVQLWHGNGFKNVGLTNDSVLEKIASDRLAKYLSHYPEYDFMIFSSEDQKKARSEAFNFKNCIINGQPRNDVILGRSFQGLEIGADEKSIEQIKDAKKAGKKVVLYAPTWRQPDQLHPAHYLNMKDLDDFLLENSILLVYKSHPKERWGFFSTSNIVVYEKDCDIYPCFEYFDLMVTDYSSIYFDFLLLDRPIVYFLYDQGSYIEERGAHHDFDDISPGEKCFTQKELHHSLLNACYEDFSVDRLQVLSKFNKYIDSDNCVRLRDILVSDIINE